MSAVLRLVIIVALACSACWFDPIDLEGKACPCELPYQCDRVSETCTRDPGVISRYAEAVIADAPVGYWRLDETSGMQANDSSGNENHGTYIAGVTLGAEGATAEGTGADFDGLAGRIVVGDRFDFLGTAPMTFEAWIRPRAILSGIARLVAKEEVDALGRQGYTVILQGTDPFTIAVERWIDMMLPGRVETGPVLDGAAFHHVAVVFDGTRVVVYVDGLSVASDISSAMLSDNGGPFVIGAQSTQANDYFNGAMDEVALYDVALGAERVRAHFDAR